MGEGQRATWQLEPLLAFLSYNWDGKKKDGWELRNFWRAQSRTSWPQKQSDSHECLPHPAPLHHMHRALVEKPCIIPWALPDTDSTSDRVSGKTQRQQGDHRRHLKHLKPDIYHKSSFQHKVTRQTKGKKKQSLRRPEKKQAWELGSDMAKILQLLDWEFNYD